MLVDSESEVYEIPVSLPCPNCDIFGQLARDRNLFIYHDIDGHIATTLVAHLLWLDLQDSETEITIYINSIGGTVSNGLLTIYDTMQNINAPIRTICIGEAYSGAAVLLSAGTKSRRFSYPNAKIMIHAIQAYDIGGSQSEVEKESKRIKFMNQSLMELMARHTGQSLTKIKRDCVEDKYFTAKEALDYGLIDNIIKPVKKIPNIKR